MKRYAVNLDAYVYARNDREALVKAAKMAEYLRKLEDNQARVTEVYYTPFASFIRKLIHKGSLTFFKNKLIET